MPTLSFNRLTVNLTSIAFSDIFARIIGFALAIILARYLGPESYGKYSLVISFVYIFVILANFGVDEFGQPLFYPAVEILEENTDPNTANWIRELAFIDGTECPTEKRYNTGDLSFLKIAALPTTVRREIFN